MKTWLLPTLAIGAVVFLMTRPGKELQEEISDNVGDWVDTISRANHRLQQALRQVQSMLEKCDRSLRQVAD